MLTCLRALYKEHSEQIARIPDKPSASDSASTGSGCQVARLELTKSFDLFFSIHLSHRERFW